MADLASAIVDLGVAAEKRRAARRGLRESADVISDAILKHVRVGDRVNIGDPITPIEGTHGLWYLYVVERVTWDVRLNYRGAYDDGYVHDEHGTAERAALVQYAFVDTDSTDYTLFSDRKRTNRGAVIGDVREKYSIWPEHENEPEHDGPMAIAEPRGHFLYRVVGPNDAPYIPLLHVATERELSIFAEHAVNVVQYMARGMKHEAAEFEAVSDKLAKLAPR